MRNYPHKKCGVIQKGCIWKKRIWKQLHFVWGWFLILFSEMHPNHGFCVEKRLILGSKIQNAVSPLQNRKGSKMGIFALKRVESMSTLSKVKIPILDPFRFCKGKIAFCILPPEISNTSHKNGNFRAFVQIIWETLPTQKAGRSKMDVVFRFSICKYALSGSPRILCGGSSSFYSREWITITVFVLELVDFRE